MGTFVMIHGAFRGGWSLARLRRRLTARGHQVLTPSLPGAGELFASSAKRVDLDLCSAAVARLLHLEDLHEVVLVGHSQGGLVVQAVSQLAPERLGALMFLDAAEPRHGERALDLIPPALTDMSPMAPPSSPLIPPPTPTPGPYLSPQDAAFLHERLTAAHVAMALTPLVLNDPRALALPRHRLFFRHTPPTFPCAHARARCDAEALPYRWLDAGHDAPFTHPEEVATAMLDML